MCIYFVCCFIYLKVMLERKIYREREGDKNQNHPTTCELESVISRLSKYLLDSINLRSEYEASSLLASLPVPLYPTSFIPLPLFILPPLPIFSTTLANATAQNLAICLNASLNEKITGIFNPLLLSLSLSSLSFSHPTARQEVVLHPSKKHLL